MFPLKKLTRLLYVQMVIKNAIDSIETYVYGTSKDLVIDKEDIKCNNIIKRYKKWLTFMML